MKRLAAFLSLVGCALLGGVANAQVNVEPKLAVEAICTASVRSGARTDEVEVLVQRVFPGKTRLMHYALNGRVMKQESVDRQAPERFGARTEVSYVGPAMAMRTRISVEMAREVPRVSLVVDGRTVAGDLSCDRFVEPSR